MSIERLTELLTKLFGDCLKHNIKYVYNKIPDMLLNSKLLCLTDYQNYYDFFIKTNPNCKNTDWLNEYFVEMVTQHLCCGLFINDIIVSCSDAPGMPYMLNDVQEIGINTLAEYIGNGYATDVCVTCVKEIIKNNKCPQWSTTIDNLFDSVDRKKDDE